MKSIMFFILMTLTAFMHGDDWSKWRGPSANGISYETGVVPSKLLNTSVIWRADVGKGYSSFAVVGNKVYTLGYVSGKDTVTCLNLLTGAVIWTYLYNNPDGDYNGPRSTPLVENGYVYTVSRTGLVNCLKADTGSMVWKNDLASTTGTGFPDWGLASSPVSYGDLIILNANTKGVALNKYTGALVWKSAAGVPGYSSATFMKISGTDQLLLFGEKFLYGINPVTGSVLWTYAWKTNYDVNAADPVVLSGNRVFISSGYNTGCTVLEISSTGAKKIWQNKIMSNHYNSSVYINSKIIGIDSTSYSLRAINPEDGTKIWEVKTGIGAFTVADNKILFTTEAGEVIILDLAGNILARFKAGSFTTWTTPVYSNGYFLTRNDKGKVICLKLK